MHACGVSIEESKDPGHSPFESHLFVTLVNKILRMAKEPYGADIGEQRDRRSAYGRNHPQLGASGG